ncbi:flagellar M-ring protein FliF [Nordella sp. HKS 07]|uniref:flagellar basal-body MS-ring/collar protein FliF n=1 Tax=Nordella sp. HKS 07 TaxID=2712222 RepID=UPI0013E1A7B0|nr:flagellar basal-body MS-ring/collar protein FliF [Nordella sp. HKS 07]QIG49894.1 flagellar M-ring protein FliF [Nordella sp. HKS 07]
MAYLEHAERLWGSIVGLGARRIMALAVIGLSVLAVVGLAAYFLSRPSNEILYTGLDAQDVTRVGAALTEAGIPFDVNAEGTAIMVRYGQTAKARMLLAEKGLPRSETAGYELFDNMGSLGLTSFMQQVTRVRVLEGEIARTIQSMKGIKAARVHIVMPDGGSFRRTQQQPTASVVIRTDTSDEFGSAQAIRHMVAAAVPGLAVDQVTVLNTSGVLLASGGDLADAAPGKLAGLERTVGQEVQDNIAKTLVPYLGLENFQVSVAARLNTDKKQTNETIFDPESRAERSVRVVKESGTTQNTSGKSSVSVTQNLPEGQQEAPSADNSTQESERREELTNFEINSKTISTVSDGYRIENLSVAVVVNRDRIVELLGKDAKPEDMQAQTREIEQLVASAAGLDEARGDKVKITAVQFFQNGAATEPVAGDGIGDQLLRQSGTLINAVTVLAVAALLIWFGLKPALRTIMQPEALPQSMPPGLLPGASAAAQDGALGIMSGDEPNLIEDVTSRMRRTPQKRLEQMVEYDDEQAAAILKQWILEAKPA